MPQEGKLRLADETDLPLSEFDGWATSLKAQKEGDLWTIRIFVESVWFIRRQWDWREVRISNRDWQEYWSWYGESMTTAALRKLRSVGGNDFRIEDLNWESRRKLADLVQLDETDITLCCKLEKVEERSGWFMLTVKVRKCWLNSPKRDEWDWQAQCPWESNKKDYAEYTCKGLCDRERAEHPESFSQFAIPAEGRQKLADKVGLDANEFYSWVHRVWLTNGPEVIEFHAEVPNVWICADLLRGGTFRPIYLNPAGSIGQVAAEIVNCDKKVIICRSNAELARELQNCNGKLWGMELYGHGSPIGVIANSSSNDAYYPPNPNYPTKILANYNYKLAVINLRQCYSGFAGNNYTDEFTPHWWEPAWSSSEKNTYATTLSRVLNNSPQIATPKVRTTESGIEYTITVDWKCEWEKYGIIVKTYSGLNVIGLDI